MYLPFLPSHQSPSFSTFTLALIHLCVLSPFHVLDIRLGAMDAEVRKTLLALSSSEPSKRSSASGPPAPCSSVQAGVNKAEVVPGGRGE